MKQSFFHEHAHSEKPFLQPELEEQMSSRFELGKLLGEYPGDTRNFFIPGAIVAFVITCALLFFSIMTPPFSGYLLLGSCGWLIATAGCSFFALRWRVLTILLYENGLIWKQSARTGERFEVVRWEQVEKFWCKFKSGNSESPDTYTYKLQRADSVVLKLDDLQNIQQLGELIESKVTRQLLSRATAAYNAGQNLSFDILDVNAQGITIEDTHKVLSFNDVDYISANDETVKIYARGQKRAWYQQSTKKLPNVMLLKALIDHIVMVQQGRDVRTKGQI